MEPRVTSDHLDKATEPKESLGQSGYDVSSRILFKALWSVIEFRIVQCGFGFSCFLGFTICMWLWPKPTPGTSRGRERERKVEIGFGCRTVFFACLFLGLWSCIVHFAFQFGVGEQVSAAKSLVLSLRTTCRSYLGVLARNATFLVLALLYKSIIGSELLINISNDSDAYQHLWTKCVTI